MPHGLVSSSFVPHRTAFSRLSTHQRTLAPFQGGGEGRQYVHVWAWRVPIKRVRRRQRGDRCSLQVSCRPQGRLFLREPALHPSVHSARYWGDFGNCSFHPWTILPPFSASISRDFHFEAFDFALDFSVTRRTHGVWIPQSAHAFLAIREVVSPSSNPLRHHRRIFSTIPFRLSPNYPKSAVDRSRQRLEPPPSPILSRSRSAWPSLSRTVARSASLAELRQAETSADSFQASENWACSVNYREG